jgi:putative transcriptional regulator
VGAVFPFHRCFGNHQRDLSLFRNAAVLMKNELRLLRAMHSRTQGELAEQLGVSRQTMNAIEQKGTIRDFRLLSRSHVFKCRIEDVFFASNGNQRG